MTIFDYGVLMVVAASLLLGLWRGLVSEALALLAWVAAFIVAREAAPALAALFTAWISDPVLAYVAGFAAAFIAVLVAVGVVRLVLRKLLTMVGLGVADRILGGVFGLARALLIVLALVLVGGMTAMPKQAWWRNAATAPPLETAVLAAKPWLPPELAKRVRYR